MKKIVILVSLICILWPVLLWADNQTAIDEFNKTGDGWVTEGYPLAPEKSSDRDRQTTDGSAKNNESSPSDNQRKPLWLDINFSKSGMNNSAGSLDGTSPLAVGGTLHFGLPKGLLSFRVITMQNEVFTSRDFYDHYKTANQATEIGVLYGFYGRENHALCTGSIGISNVSGEYVDNVRNNDYNFLGERISSITFDRVDFSTVGFALDFQLAYVGSSAGLGLYIFADNNDTLSFFGVGINVLFGRF